MPRVLVGQLLDDGNHNAQVSNAANIIARSADSTIEWIVPYYDEPDRRLVGQPNVELRRLVRGSLWRLHKSAFYRSRADVLFYPGPYWFDALGLALRHVSGNNVPLVATLEGLVGRRKHERTLSGWAGHPVYCQNVLRRDLTSQRLVYSQADHIVALSPFLAQMGRRLYGDKLSVLPLGVDEACFFPPGSGHRRPNLVVVSAGRVAPHKRPELFLDLARRYPDVRFRWFGEGQSRQELLGRTAALGLYNLDWPGSKTPTELASEFRQADIFVMPSQAEGVPKVTQEAAACSLPVIIFGYYRAPTVIDGVNGYVVWSDAEFKQRLGQLIEEHETRLNMGEKGVEMAGEWGWGVVSKRWIEMLAGFAR